MIRIYSLLLLVSLLFVCTQYPDDNPYDPDYQGDYFLIIDWENLPDTLGAFIDYIIPYSCSNGRDSLYKFTPDSALKNIIDTTIFKTCSDSSFKFYFTKEGSKDISILGYALNNTEIVSNDTTVTITTPFLIIPITTVVFGEQFSCSLSVFNQFNTLFTKDFTDSVIWSYNESDSIRRNILDTICFPVTNQMQFTVKAIFYDANKNRSKEISRNFNVTTIPPLIDAPDTFSHRVATVYLPITFSDGNDTVDTAFCVLNNDTTKKKVVYLDRDTIAISTGYTPLLDTLLLWVKDKSGLTSSVDTTVLTTFIPDFINPVIYLKDSTSDTIISGRDSFEVDLVAKDNYGVSHVTYIINADTSNATQKEDSIWSALIINIPNSQYVEISAHAIDSFNNDSAVSFHVYVDPSVLDTALPELSLISTPFSNNRITDDTGTIEVKVWDENGIDTVFCSFNGLFAGAGVEKSDSIYEIPFQLNNNYGNHTLSIIAIDNSYYHNNNSIDTTINYNTVPTNISNISPADNAIDVENLGGLTFSWDHALDADGDQIVYQIAYGTDIGSLTKDTLSINTYSANGLLGGINYIWHVKIMTSLDTLFSPLDSTSFYLFKTIDHPATITITHVDSATINDSVTFRVSAQDDEGIKEYYWDFNGDGAHEDTTIDTITKSTYPSANIYTVIVTVADVNDSTTSDNSAITITNDFPVIKANPASDTLYVGYNDSIIFTPSATDDGTIVLYEWSFDSGNTFIQNSGVGDTSFLADTENLPKLPYYIFRATDEDNNSSVDTAYALINMIWDSITDDSWIINRESFPVINDDNEIFVLGGWIGGTIKRDVWRSTDGEVWQNIAEANSFTQRYRHAATIKNDTIYVAGGDVTHDIWQSVDSGITWDSIGDLKDIDILYQNKLAGAEMVTFKDTFYLLGGNYGASKTNKVFSSRNGIDWDSLNIYYQVAGRRFKDTENFSAFANNDSLWVFAENEVWHSDPVPFGDSWTKDSTVSEFSGYGGVIIYNGTIYAVSGNTFWYSLDRGKSWQRMTSSAPWTESGYLRAAVFNNKMFVFTDKGIWYSTDTP